MSVFVAKESLIIHGSSMKRSKKSFIVFQDGIISKVQVEKTGPKRLSST